MTPVPSPDPSDRPELDQPARILLGPGPSMVHPRVQRALAAPSVGHLDPTLFGIMDRIQALLRYTFQTENPLTLAVTGTGSAAMEAAVANMVEPGDSVLVCIKGYFGSRIADMTRRYTDDVQTINRPWGEVFAPDEVAQALDRHPARIVAIVHAETSTGVAQPLDEIARVVHDQNGILIADAVTSLGGAPLRVDEAGIDVCYSATQKCLGCPPGLGPITLSPRAEEKLSQRRTPVANWYLDLSLLRRYWGPERAYHHTASSPMVYALYEGLRLVAEEGLEDRWARHRRNAELLWKGLASLDLTLHVPEDRRLPVLTAARIPTGVDDAAVRQQLLRRYNIEIGGGLGELKGKIWRIGLMGYSSVEENILLLLAALGELLN